MLDTWSPVLLEAVATLGALLVLLVDLFTPAPNKRRVGLVALGVTVVTALVAWFGLPTDGTVRELFGGSMRLDPLALFLKRTFALAGVLAVVVVRRWEDRLPRGAGEYHFLVLTALTGMFLCSGVGDFMTLFVALELVTLSFFILAAFKRSDSKSVEAGLKLLVLGSLSAAFVLFGAALIYGVVGSLDFYGDPMQPEIRSLQVHLFHLHGAMPDATLVLGLLFVFLGLGFKIGMVPMQVWIPDVYEGSPSPTTAFLSVGSKAAGFALLLRLVSVTATEGTKPVLQLLFGAAAFATLFYGNLAAIPQKNLKRLLGYSSISHAGYLVLGLAALGPASRFDAATAAEGTSAILFYLLAFAVTNMTAFLVIVLFSEVSGTHEIDGYKGLSRRSPLLAASLTIALLSLAGVPPLAGFFGKFMLLRAVALNGPASFWLLVAAGINVVIGLYYYLCVIKRMYIHEAEGDDSAIAVSGSMRTVLLLLVAAMVGIGIFPGPFVRLAGDAAKAAFGL